MKRAPAFPRTLPGAASATGSATESAIGSTDAARADAAPPDERTPAHGNRLTREQLDPLVKAATCGDTEAVAKIIALISPAVARYCRARLGGRDLAHISADDIAQEACLAVLKALPAYQDRGGSFLYLVHAITSNKVADAFRSVSRDRSEPVPELPELALGENAPERSALDSDLRARLERLLAHLPRVQQEILVLRIAVGLSANETAEAVGLSAGNVRTAQHRALARLRLMAAGEAW